MYLVAILTLFTVQVQAEVKQGEIVKIGVYEYEPYFRVDAHGNMSGYYYDFMKLLQEKLPFEYEFVVVTLADGLSQLVEEKIDLMMGISMNTQLEENILFNRYKTNLERFGIFSDEAVDLEDLALMTDVKLGLVEGDVNAEWILDYLKAESIDVVISYEKDYEVLIQQLENNIIDLYVDNKCREKDYHLVYEFSSSDVYIAGNKTSQSILTAIDEAIEQLESKETNPIVSLYEQYFGSTDILDQYLIKTSFTLVALLFILGISNPIKQQVIKNKIKRRLKKNQYLLQYQPIYNPRTNKIIGFEGLLRLLDRSRNLIPPFKFIPEIEKNGMMFEISLWLVERAIQDYDHLKSCTCLDEQDFYVSINLSLNELENEAFIDQVIEKLKHSNLGEQKICLEIIERFKMNDLQIIARHIHRLKEAGFKIAIDDFGVEYSNLDVFQQLDVDIIKVDKVFVDGISDDSVKREVVLFISRLARIGNRSVVLEGVEEANQDREIKAINNDQLYVQGYYYYKPMFIEDIIQL